MADFLQLLQLGMSTGVLAGGIGIAKWAFGIERRLLTIEITSKTKENHEKANHAA